MAPSCCAAGNLTPCVTLLGVVISQAVLGYIRTNEVQILDDPNVPVNPALIKLRDAQFKRNHLRRMRGAEQG